MQRDGDKRGATKRYRHCGFSATEKKNLIVICCGRQFGMWLVELISAVEFISSVSGMRVAQKVFQNGLASIFAATAREGSGDGASARERGSAAGLA